MKQFYNAWLVLIKNDLARASPSGFFEKYRTLIEGKSFTREKELTIDERIGQDDFQLIEVMDVVLIDLFGFTAYTDLMSGILSISENVNKKVNIDWILHTGKTQLELIQGLFVLSSYSSPRYGVNYFAVMRPHLIQGKRYPQSSWFFSNMKLNGFWRLLSGKRISATGEVLNIKEYRVETKPTGSAFIHGYFSHYQNMNNRLYAKANNLFLHNEFSKTLDPAWVNSRNLIQRHKIQQFFYEKIKAAGVAQLVEKIPEYSNSEESKKFWTEITEKLAESFVRTFTEDPTPRFDYVQQLRDIIHSRKDDYITISGVKGGGVRIVNPQLLAENKILGSREGLKLFISYEEAQKIWNDIWLTLNFKAVAGVSGGMNPKGYNLDITPVLNNLQNKITYIYDRFYNLFSQGESKEYTIFFTTLKGKGLATSSKFTNTYGEILNIKKNTISFKIDNENPQAFQEAIASMVFYLLFIPNAYVVVKDSYNIYSNSAKIFFVADIFGLYSYEYIELSTYSQPYGGAFTWSQTEGEFTPDNYALWQQNFKGIFNPEDIRMFLRFHNDENMLTYLMNWYNKFLRVYNPFGVNLEKFKQITDLRI